MSGAEEFAYGLGDDEAAATAHGELGLAVEIAHRGSTPLQWGNRGIRRKQGKQEEPRESKWWNVQLLFGVDEGAPPHRVTDQAPRNRESK
ncbi:hypothetical protein Shyd_74860 [Streptomyces hydrogenans]|uniref:Uncharacterized protein n=1 Tax=Streptomyces hydrogenans TaxID=1873719 RepID=A0ABQ3PM62_9ACTN|nr:hypothetical protein GCM10018784_05060 [Streptomyces hydrogenans]GHI26115.1 hypothetical protein Shyd_74860 [Streptomyces hydrogenans]